MMMRKILAALALVLLVTVGASAKLFFQSRGVGPAPGAPFATSITYATNPATVASTAAPPTVVSNFTVNMSDNSVYEGSSPTVQSCSQSPCPLAVAGGPGAWAVVTASSPPLPIAANQTLVVAAGGVTGTLIYTIQQGGVVTAVAQWLMTPASITGTIEADNSGNGNTATVVAGPLGFNALSANFNGTSQYLTSSLTLGQAPAITSVTTLTAANTFAANRQSAVVGTIAVTTSIGSFTGQLSITGTNNCGFYLSGNQVLANPAVGCAAGTYSGWNIVATQPGASNSPYTQAEAATATAPVYPLSAAAGGRYLQTASGNPFLVVGENAETLAQSLPVTGTSSGDANANATFYLSTRAGQGMNAIWLLAYCGGYNACNTNSLSPTYDGLRPFTATIGACGTTAPQCLDMSTAGAAGNTGYWSRLDQMIQLAGQYGITVFLMPAGTNGCGTNGNAPEWTMLLNNHAASSGGHTLAYLYGQFLGARYKNYPNIVWWHGNDYQCNGQGGGSPAADDLPVMDIMQGIAASGDAHLSTIELAFFSSASFDNGDFLPGGPGGGGDVNLNGVYTYYPAYYQTLHAWNQSTAPVVVLEEYYEGSGSYLSAEPTTTSCYFPGSTNCLYEYEIRKQFWQGILGGAIGGYVFGNDPIGSNGFCTWNGGSNCTAGTGWTNYMNSPGWRDYQNWKNLFTGIAFQTLVPDQNNVVVTGGRGTYNGSGCTSGNPCLTQDNYVPAAVANTGGNNKYLVAYLGCYASNGTYGCTGSGGVTVAMNQLGSGATARWYDPTTGGFTTICSPSGTACGAGSQTFTPPGVNSAGDPDWVLTVAGTGCSLPMCAMIVMWGL